MHMTIVWAVNDFSKTKEITEQIVATLAPYERVQVFPNAYIVKVANLEASNNLSTSLIQLATTWGNAFNIIMTPPINAGRYSGRMSASLWPEINRLTD